MTAPSASLSKPQTPDAVQLATDVQPDASQTIWKRLSEVRKVHEIAITAFVMLAILAVIFTPVEKEWLKFLLINGVVILAKEVGFCHIGVADGISIGYLVRGLHNLAIAVLGDLSALPSGLFWTLWAINIKDYG